ncbi:MAG TPA: hypothetical protein EYO86_06065 [Pelagibacterales bacterium]|nr:hypothetical protein [Pelagibacterales bacterium]
MLIYNIFLRYFILLAFLLVVFSCNKIEVLDQIVFDYNQLPKIVLSAEQKKITETYEAKFSDPFIDHSLIKPPKEHLKSWIDSNLAIIGTENKLIINIIDSSLTKSEVENANAKKYEEKTIYLFEINYLAEYILYDDSNSILSSTTVETKRSITSGKFISLMESDRIIESLILDALTDFAKKTEELIKIHMSGYIL